MLGVSVTELSAGKVAASYTLSAWTRMMSPLAAAMNGANAGSVCA
ncbi:MAG: hypothetical protein AABP62_16800 [Planctomycetota bacterium]